MNKQNIIKFIKDYDIFIFLIAGLLIIIIKNPIFYLFCDSFNITEYNSLYEPFYYFLSALLFIAWLYFFLINSLQKYYKLKTGRNLYKDTSSFKKSFLFLLNFFSHNDPYKMDISKLPVEDWKKADGVILAKVKDGHGHYHLIKRPSDANGNLISFGLPGSGKSTTEAATSALRFNANVKPGGCGVFAISIKGDLLKFVSGKRTNIKVFTPDQADGSCHYNPLDGVSEMNWTDRRIFAENLSIIICPDEAGDNSSFFVEGARNYLSGIILYLLYLEDENKLKEPLSFPFIIDTILSTNVFDITLEIKNCGNTIPGEYTNSFIGSNDKNCAGIWSHLCKCIRPFNTGALRTLFDGKGNCITPNDLNTGDIYIDVPQDKYKMYAPAMAIIITNFLQAFMRRADVSSHEKVTPILFLLDEAVQLNLDFDILSQAMSTLRSKKVSLFLLMQSIAQIEGRYGEAHSREIIDLCAYITVFNAQDPKSRKYFQELVGRRKMLKRSSSISTSSQQSLTTQSSNTGVNISVVDEYIFEAADFGNLNETDPKTNETKHQVLVYANGE